MQKKARRKSKVVTKRELKGLKFPTIPRCNCGRIAIFGNVCELQDCIDRDRKATFPAFETTKERLEMTQ